jgi:hypothetical protein
MLPFVIVPVMLLVCRYGGPCGTVPVLSQWYTIVFKVLARCTFMSGLRTYWNPQKPSRVLHDSSSVKLWSFGWRLRTEGQIKWQARGLTAHNGEGYHRPWVGVHSGLVVRGGFCGAGLPQTEVLTPVRRIFGTGQPSLFSWRFFHCGRFCCHYSEHKRGTGRYFRYLWSKKCCIS